MINPTNGIDIFSHILQVRSSSNYRGKLLPETEIGIVIFCAAFVNPTEGSKLFVQVVYLRVGHATRVSGNEQGPPYAFRVERLCTYEQICEADANFQPIPARHAGDLLLVLPVIDYAESEGI